MLAASDIAPNDAVICGAPFSASGSGQEPLPAALGHDDDDDGDVDVDWLHPAMDTSDYPRLTEAHMDGLFDNDTALYVKNLDLSARYHELCANNFLTRLVNCVNTRTLVITAVQLQDSLLQKFLVKLPLLKNLVITECRAISATSMATLSTSCKQLQTLSVSGCELLNSRTVTTTLSELPHVVHLGISGLPLTSPDLLTICRTHSLKDLSASNCWCVDDRLLTQLLPSLSQIESLNLSYTKVTNASILPVLDRCPNLKWLDLSSTYVETVSLCHRLAEMPNLRTLYLSKVGDDACRELAHSQTLMECCLQTEKAITQYALMTLASCKSLRKISIPGANIPATQHLSRILEETNPLLVVEL
ncbi:hypothetical protein Pelo_3603 [Pelomyxa schiedti]|nr:hypothetical protein Pelo_3603 [Pelomyxa schiedti]